MLIRSLWAPALLCALLAACGGPRTDAPATKAEADAASPKAAQAEPSPTAAPVAAVDGARIIAANEEPGAWLAHGRTYSEQRFSPLSRITSDNVDELGLTWAYKLDYDRATEATPIVVDGVMYVTGPYSVVSALNPVTGTELWKYDPKVALTKAREGCCGPANRGVAVWKGKVYVGIYDGRLAALDAKTGKVVWEVNTIVDENRSYTITGAPRVVKDMVIIGNGGAELGVRGYITAYDTETGAQKWRFFTVPGNPENPPENKAMELALPTWTGKWWEFGGGGTVWDAMAYDPELDLFYIGVGNGSTWNRAVRSPEGGDNLFVSSIVALKPDTGEYVWHYQTTPGDNWDYTATQHMVLAELQIDGKPRKVLMQAPKNGFFYVLDRETGELLSAEKFAPANWASHVDMETGRPVETENADWSKEGKLVSPGPLGAHNWMPMSFNPQTGLVYIPMQEAIAYLAPAPDEQYAGKGTWHLGAQPLALPENKKEFDGAVAAHRGHLIAWDPVAQKEVWRQSHVTVWNGGTLSTAGNLVFQGTADGRFVAYTADKGEKLWESPANSGVMAGPITYEIDGEQYVTVAAGWGGGFPLALGGLSLAAKVQPDSRILTYKLGGTAKLPPPKPGLIEQPAPPKVTGTEAQIAAGRDLYNSHCGMCHGPNAIGSSMVPDLRYMTAETHAMFPGILAGARAQQGMPPMMDVLKPEDVQAIHQYLIKRANDLHEGLKAAAKAPEGEGG